MKIFEIIMLVCFGSAWPLSIYKSWKSRTNSGKSPLFLIVIFTGYVSGILYKTLGNYDYVIYLYYLNAVLVGLDLGLYARNHFLGKRTANAAEPSA